MSGSESIAVDIGGTFTDFIKLDERTGEMAVVKLLTTPKSPERGVLEGIDVLSSEAASLADVQAVIHATTLATNAIIERKGQKTALITTSGFEDILEIGRGYRYDLYDLMIRRPKPLIVRPFRRGVRERIGSNGSIVTPLDERDVRKVAESFREEGIEAVAVCYLHSYLNPSHEVRTAEILTEIIPGVAVSLSHQVIAEPKEFERTSTTAVDAYIKPTMARYLEQLEGALEERSYKRGLRVMLSNGGAATSDTAKRFPVQMLESGPAAGVEAASYFARLLGLETLLAFDMGGTTAKLCLVQGGRASRTRNFEIHHVHRFKAGSGLPVSLPVYDLLEIGAGGGSIARIDSLGLIQVGPDSAGADPGPACYGGRGDRPTVTDADLILGFLDADKFLGGDMKLNKVAGSAAIERHIAKPMGITVAAAAWGIHDLVNENMAGAARVHIAERGEDATRLSLVAFGGAGPVHALGVARKLGCPRLIIPPRPGVLSAFGLLVAPVSFERTQAVRTPLEKVNAADLLRISKRLEADIRELMPQDAAKPATARVTMELLYLGQDHPVEIDVVDLAATNAKSLIKEEFERAYKALYGTIDDMPIEVISLRVKVSQLPAQLPNAWAANGKKAKIGTREIYLMETGGFALADVYDRNALAPGDEIVGPAVIIERESTTIIGARDHLSVDGSGCLVIDLASANTRAQAKN